MGGVMGSGECGAWVVSFPHTQRSTSRLIPPHSTSQPSHLTAGGAVHNAGLRLLHHSFVVTPCPFREAYRANKGDPAAHAKWMIPTFRCVASDRVGMWLCMEWDVDLTMAALLS